MFSVYIFSASDSGIADPYREGQIYALDRAKNMAAKFAHHRNDSNWETLTELRKIAGICTREKGLGGL
jgi:hypothetical protein